MQSNDLASPENLTARLLSVQKRVQVLEGERNRNEAHLGVASAHLASLRAEALQQFGTDDPDKLLGIAKRIAEESEMEVTRFEREVSAIETALQEMAP